MVDTVKVLVDVLQEVERPVRSPRDAISAREAGVVLLRVRDLLDPQADHLKNTLSEIVWGFFVSHGVASCVALFV